MERRLGTFTPGSGHRTHRWRYHSSARAAACGTWVSKFCGLVSDRCVQDAQDLDFERLIRTVIATHTRAIFREFALRLQHTPVFSLPGAVRVVEEGTCAGIYTRVVSLISDCK